jgi:alpha-glucoside transport system permease protein|tara:strand:- start:733 stop:1632 length:900 start_codon:yes stop_codon:yes gene_type:complete
MTNTTPNSKNLLSFSTRLITWTNSGLVHLTLVILGLVWLTPSLGLLITSLRSRADIAQSGWWTSILEWRFNLENYVEVLNNSELPSPGFKENIINSIIITVPSTILPIIVASLFAYVIVFTKLRIRNFLYLLIIALMVVPLQVTWFPVLSLYKFFDITGSWTGIWLAHTAYGTPFAVFLLRNFFSEIPEEIIESAKLDCNNHFQIFTRIVLPLSLPALASLAIFQFVWVWNDLMNAIVFLQNVEKYPLTVGIQKLLGHYQNEWHLLAAGAWLTMLVPLLIFFSLQRYFVRGVTAGAVKG